MLTPLNEVASAALLGILGLVFALLCWRMPLQRVVAIAVFLALPQIIVTIQPQAALAVLWAVAAVSALLRCVREVATFTWLAVLPLCALIILFLVATLWSPSVSSALTTLSQLVAFTVMCLLITVVHSRSPSAVQTVVRFNAVTGAIFAATVVAFRLFPDLEAAYFRSPVFGWFVGHELAADFTTLFRNNALDPAKSGGLFFVNANVASLFLGVSAVALAAFTLRQLKSVWGALVIVQAAAIPFTGSKTGIVLLLLALAVVAGYLLLRRMTRVRPLLLAGMLGAVGITFAVVLISVPNLLGALTDSGRDRLAIWSVAGQLFMERPWGGYGFGGWAAEYAPRAATQGHPPAVPPHNWLIQLWSEVGFVAAIAAMVFAVFVAARYVRVVIQLRTLESLPALLLLVGWLWLVIHGLGDNTAFYGEAHIFVIAAAIAAVAINGGRTMRSSVQAAGKHRQGLSDETSGSWNRRKIGGPE